MDLKMMIIITVSISSNSSRSRKVLSHEEQIPQRVIYLEKSLFGELPITDQPLFEEE